MTVANLAGRAVPSGGVKRTHQVGERVSRLAALVLGLVATFTSAMVTVLAGAERGGSKLEQDAWIAIGLTLLLSAHFMPSLARRRQLHIRIAAGVLWVLSLLATGYTHATFFVNAQRDAGLQRAQQIPLSTLPTVSGTGRLPNEIAQERAKAETELESARLAKCTTDCRWLTLRRDSLSSKLAALNIEFDEARRREQIVDSQLAERRNVLAKRDAAEADPVSIRLAHLIHSDDNDVSFGLAISLGLLLEIVASMSWVLACHGIAPPNLEPQIEPMKHAEGAISVVEAPRAVPPEVSLIPSAAVRWNTTWPTAANASTAELVPATDLSANDRKVTRMTVDLQVDLSAANRGADNDVKSKVLPLSDEEMLAELVRAISNGETRSTLNGIKRYTGYVDAHAMALRSRLVVHHPELFGEPVIATTS